MTNPVGSPAKTPVIAEPPHGLMFPERSPQLIALLEMDMRILAIGYRISGIIGRSIVNDDDESVGKIEDLIIAPSEQVFFAVLSVGGFLGIDTKHVVVPYRALEVNKEHVMFLHVTKDSVQSLPEFKFRN